MARVFIFPWLLRKVGEFVAMWCISYAHPTCWIPTELTTHLSFSLVASTNRGCKAISQGSGAVSTIVGDGITRAPCIQLPSAQEAAQVMLWIKEPANFLKLKESFESTTSFGKLIEASPTVAGRNVYVRLRCFSGDAMGMNSKCKDHS